MNKRPLLFYTSSIKGYDYNFCKITKIKSLKEPYISAIIDVGIYDLVLKYKDKPFPKDRIKNTWNLLNSDNLDKRWLIATGDYPNLPNEFGINIKYNNVNETLANWHYFAKAKNWKQGIYTLQSMSISDYETIIKDYEKFPLQLNNEDIPCIGVGSLCRLIKGTKNEKLLVHKLLKYVRERYPNAFIHVWGASIHHLDALYMFADSFDSTKWTRPCNSYLPKRKCKNYEERVLYLNEYLNRINSHKIDPSLFSFLDE